MVQQDKDIQIFQDIVKGKDDKIDELDRKLNDQGWVRKERLDEVEDLNKKLVEFYVMENTKLKKTVRDCNVPI